MAYDVSNFLDVFGEMLRSMFFTWNAVLILQQHGCDESVCYQQTVQ
jgi:hypothetical protein